MVKQKTPIVYYGGKQNIAEWIISHFPPHQSYIEPFAGGLAVFFARQKRPKIEVINDINSEVYNFYLQWRENPQELLRLLRRTPYSLEDYNHCLSVYKQETKASGLERARAFFVLTHSSFAGAIGNGWGRRPNKRGGITAKGLIGKTSILRSMTSRLREVVIENRDALSVIKSWDNEKALFYLDPPYPETDQKHYSGYSMKDFNQLLEALKSIKGKFILSCYQKNKMDINSSWNIFKKKTKCLIHTSVTNKESREESIILNYEPPKTRLL